MTFPVVIGPSVMGVQREQYLGNGWYGRNFQISYFYGYVAGLCNLRWAYVKGKGCPSGARGRCLLDSPVMTIALGLGVTHPPALDKPEDDHAQGQDHGTDDEYHQHAGINKEMWFDHWLSPDWSL